LTNASKSIYKKADSFSRLARRHGYRSRSSLKLIEIQKKYRFIKEGNLVLDLGCSPGGWSQVTNRIIGKKGKVFGVDLKNMDPISEVNFVKKDVQDLVDKDFQIKGKVVNSFDIVLSDIAPNISGIGPRDDALIIELLEKIQIVVDTFLKTEGDSLVKVFQGESFDKMMIYMKSRFQKVRISKPVPSRSNSRETYILGLDKRK
tara:strand:- start:1203 stop:1811 length:609 start_codon:yes stop_codon:yes gene_type:complete